MICDLDVYDFDRLAEVIYRKAGIRFEQKKIYFLAKRVWKRMQALGIKTPGNYVRYLKFQDHSGTELQHFLNLLTVNETYFFRDFSQLQAFAEYCLEKTISKKKEIGDRTIRIWSAGCSSGEEPYTLAIILLEMLDDPTEWDIKILASDIDQEVIKKARAGVYKPRSLKDVPAEYIQKYFRQAAGMYHLDDETKNMVNFRHINLSDRWQIRKCNNYDFIFCRNVLIYFDDISRKKVVDHFYIALNNGGYIFLGSSESASRINPAFKIEKSGSHLVYRKK